MRFPRFSSHLGKNIVIAVSLVAAGFFIAWLRFRPHLGTQGAYTDGFRHYEGLAEEPIRYAVWDRAEELPGEVNSEEAEHRPTTSPDGRWLVFSTGERGLNADLWIAVLEDGKAQDPRPLYELNTTSDELAPAFGDDGLYFATNRPGGEGGFDLWRAPFAGGQFGTAEPLAGGVNGAQDETDPAPLPGGEALAFATNRDASGGRRGHDLYLARPGPEQKWNVEPFQELNSRRDDREPAFTRDGRRVVFASDRDGEPGSFDLFGSLFDRGEWLAPLALSGLNSDASERGPAPAGDGFTMIFEVERDGRAADLFRAKSLELFQHPGPTVGWLDLVILVTLLLLALLAWLAKRWESIEALYKCFLVSAIAHAALLWWFNGIHPEGGLEELVPGSPTFQVRLAAAASGQPAAARERGGALEVEAELARQQDGEPAKREPALPESAVAKAAPAMTLLREAAPSAPVPERSIVEAAERTLQSPAPTAALEDRPHIERQLAAPAPALAVEASSIAAIATHAEESLANPTRSVEVAAAVPLSVPRRSAAAKSERLEPEVLPGPSSRAVVDPPVALRETTRTAQLAGPNETFNRQPEAARELELAARVARLEPSARTGQAPRRVERSAAQKPLALERSAEPAPTPAMAILPTTTNAPRRELAKLTRRELLPEAENRVRTPSESFKRREEETRELEVVAREASEEPAARTRLGPRRVERAAAQEPRELERSPEPAPTPAMGIRPATPDAPRRELAKLTRRSHQPETESPVRAPSESFERQAEGTPELELVAREADAKPASRAGLGPRRVESAAEKPPAFETRPDPTPAMARSGQPRAAEPPRRELTQHAPRKYEARAETSVRAPRDFEVARAVVEAAPQPERIATLHVAAPTAVPAERSAPPLAEPTRYSADRAALVVAPTRRTFQPEARIAEAVESSTPADRFEHTPYRARFGPAKARALEEFGGTVETEEAVAAGLAYLADRQQQEGFWGDPQLRDDKYGYVLVGKSGLALLAFLGAGHTQSSGTEYSDEVEKAIQFLLAVQGDRSGHFGDASAYSHGIGTYALAEDYALTRDERLREPLERAVVQILRHQNQRQRDARRFGGWSYYYPGDRTYDSWPRVSITSWQVMALESARLAGLEIPADALRDAKTFLSAALDENRGCFVYSHDPSRLRSAYAILPGSTPAALFALSLLGEDLGQDRYAAPIEFVLERAPRRYRYGGDDQFVSRAQGNLYFWYYGSLAMMRRGGPAWQKWNERLKGTLLDGQRDDGSWKPISIYSEYAGDSDDDAIYSTAMCVLSLEVYYRYFTPLLQKLGGTVEAAPATAK